MNEISTGEPATLGTYRKIAELFGPAAVRLIDEQIAKSPKGVDEEVIADESQVLLLLAQTAQDDSDQTQDEARASSLAPFI